jgi:hypothetical protein
MYHNLHLRRLCSPVSVGVTIIVIGEYTYLKRLCSPVSASDTIIIIGE